MVGMRPNISRKALWQVKFVHCQFNLGLRCPMRFKISDLMLGSWRRNTTFVYSHLTLSARVLRNYPKTQASRHEEF
jgi:hypothetical protein